MILRRAPQMLKKPGINKRNGTNYLTFMVRIVHVCVVKPRDARSRRGELKKQNFHNIEHIWFSKTCLQKRI